jgi:hypothetical protein
MVHDTLFTTKYCQITAIVALEHYFVAESLNSFINPSIRCPIEVNPKSSIEHWILSNKQNLIPIPVVTQIQNPEQTTTSFTQQK